MRTAETSLIPDVALRIGTLDIAATGLENVDTVKVVDHLRLPNQLVVRMYDPQIQWSDEPSIKVGAPIEIGISASGAAGTRSKTWKGLVIAVEPEFMQTGKFLNIRGYDRGYLLQQLRQTKAWKDVTVSDVVREVVSSAGVGLRPEVRVQGAAASIVHPYLHQTGESHWDFLWSLALEIDHEVVVEDDKLVFRPAGASPELTPIELVYPDSLLEFRPLVTGAQQVDEVRVLGWDPKSKRPIESTKRAGAPDTTIGISRDEVMSGMREAGLSGPRELIPTRPIYSQAQADALAQHAVDQAANMYVQAEGKTIGNPEIVAGRKVEIVGVGERFKGTYVVTSSEHVFKGRVGYKTRFAITGRSSRSLLELVKPRERSTGFASGLVVGVVSNITDPDKLGRIKVQFPTLGDAQESHWARLVFPHAGDGKRGIFMMPKVGDEVVVGFESGNVRNPYVIGSVFTGKAQLDSAGTGGERGKFGSKDGSLQICSPSSTVQEFGGKADVKVGESYKLDVGSDMEVVIKANKTEKAGGNIQAKANADHKLESGAMFTIKAGGNITIETSASITIKGTAVKVQGTNIDLNAPSIKIGGGTVMLG